MKRGIYSRMYYYLLDHKDNNMVQFEKMYGRGASLSGFSKSVLLDYFKHATAQDHKQFNK